MKTKKKKKSTTGDGGFVKASESTKEKRDQEFRAEEQWMPLALLFGKITFFCALLSKVMEEELEGSKL